MLVHHGKAISSPSPAFIERKLPFFFLSYVKLGETTSSIELVDANEGPSFLLPFSTDDSLYDEWSRLFYDLGKALPFLVAIPQGATGAVQVMTATVHVVDPGKSAARTGDPIVEVRIRWLHCKIIHAPELRFY